LPTYINGRKIKEKMKLEKLSIGLGAVGIFTIFIYTYKYFIQSDFTSMWLIGCGAGFGLIFIAYVYAWMKGVDTEIKRVDTRLDSFSKWFMQNKEI